MSDEENNEVHVHLIKRTYITKRKRENIEMRKKVNKK